MSKIEDNDGEKKYSPPRDTIKSNGSGTLRVTLEGSSPEASLDWPWLAPMMGSTPSPACLNLNVKRLSVGVMERLRYLRWIVRPRLLKELKALAYIRLVADYPKLRQECVDDFPVFPSEYIPKARPRSCDVVFDAASLSETSGP